MIQSCDTGAAAVPSEHLKGRCSCYRVPRAGATAFTLVELLMVVAIIALLAALLLPGLKNAGGQGKRAACQNNLKQLAAAVQMYTADNEGKLPPNFPGEDPNTWVVGNMLVPKEATNQALIRQSKLFPYAPQARLYRCPADTSQINGIARTRSFSMNGWSGSRYMQTYSHPTPYRTFLREGELAAATPASIWLIIDEHEASIDDSWFLVTMDDSRPFASFPATRHERAYNLSFGDGHLELFTLCDPQTQWLGAREAQVTAANSDWLRLKQVTTIQ